MGLLGWLGMGVASLSKRNRLIAGYLSDTAVAVIGYGDILDISYENEISDTFDKMKKHSDDLDDLFTKPLKSVFYDYDTSNFSLLKYDRLLYHFAMFKQAHLNPIIGTLISDLSLSNLVLGNIRVKLCESMSLLEAKHWRKYHEGILDYLEPCLATPGGSITDYEESIASAFSTSAQRLNPEVLSIQDCLCLREKTFSAPLIKILAEHFQMIRLACLDVFSSC